MIALSVNGKTHSAEVDRHARAQSVILADMCCRPLNLKRAALALAMLLALFASPARAGDLDDFNTAVETAMSHHRVAAGYLRTGNIDLAALEMNISCPNIEHALRTLPNWCQM